MPWGIARYQQRKQREQALLECLSTIKMVGNRTRIGCVPLGSTALAGSRGPALPRV